MARADEGGSMELKDTLHDYALLLGAPCLRMFRPVVPEIALHYGLVAHLCPVSTPSFVGRSSEGPKGAQRV